MFTKNMLKHILRAAPRYCRCFIVIAGHAHEIKAVVSSRSFSTGPIRLWFIAGEEANHQPPQEVHQPCNWLNRQHNGKAAQ